MPVEDTRGGSGGPICPNCRQPLRGGLQHEQIGARGAAGGDPSRQVAVFYCGSCGWILHVDPVESSMLGGGPWGVDVSDPTDESTLEGRFQLRCRELIVEIRALGFDPYVWAGLINDLGAVAAARRILANCGILPVTRWLVEQGHPELTLEREIEQVTWADLFTDDDRSHAARRLGSAGWDGPDG